LGPIIMMGVTGSGKTTFGTALAQHLDVDFIEGDALHPALNIAKMSAGIPLTDEDRWPWLASIARALSEKQGAVASCSALKRVYRDKLRAGSGPALRFICLIVPRPELESRMSQRKVLFMPPGLLDSQLATFEPPTNEQDALIIDGNAPQGEQLARVDVWLKGGDFGQPLAARN
jgi:gluconokinase